MDSENVRLNSIVVSVDVIAYDHKVWSVLKH